MRMRGAVGPRTLVVACALWGLSLLFANGSALSGKVEAAWVAVRAAWQRRIDASDVDILSTYSDAAFFILFSWAALETVFWFFNLILMALYATDAFPQYRIERKSSTFDWKLFRECLLDVSIGHFIVRPFALVVLYWLFEACCPALDAPLPSFASVISQIFACIWIDDTYFYWAHRLCHTVPYIYKNIHKQHHKFRKPVGISVEYAHPLEDIFVNTLGTVLGPLLLGAHYRTFIFYTLLKLWQSIEAHSNYSFPFPFSFWSFIEGMDCADAHDFHHSHNVGNYGGMFMFWDWICGTDAAYNKFRAKKAKRV